MFKKLIHRLKYGPIVSGGQLTPERGRYYVNKFSKINSSRLNIVHVLTTYVGSLNKSGDSIMSNTTQIVGRNGWSVVESKLEEEIKKISLKKSPFNTPMYFSERCGRGNIVYLTEHIDEMNRIFVEIIPI